MSQPIGYYAGSFEQLKILEDEICGFCGIAFRNREPGDSFNGSMGYFPDGHTGICKSPD